ncbi:hypothetical protein [Parapedobacter koreensis]|uniref:hypothetical protein n=1 Tax=Parapedobacter koreensis TaxID=332977 RepID=UPI000B87F7D0|nr:hypothetical protein [Parapedobacter koreensis]
MKDLKDLAYKRICVKNSCIQLKKFVVRSELLKLGKIALVIPSVKRLVFSKNDFIAIDAKKLAWFIQNNGGYRQFQKLSGLDVEVMHNKPKRTACKSDSLNFILECDVCNQSDVLFSFVAPVSLFRPKAKTSGYCQRLSLTVGAMRIY